MQTLVLTKQEQIMKLYFISALFAIFSMPIPSFSQSYINNMGDCESPDSRLHYDNFAFFSADALDSLKYTHMFSFYCGSGLEAMGCSDLHKEFFNPFHYISYDSVDYSLGSMIIHLIYSKNLSINSSNEFIIELEIDGTNKPLAFVYGSDHEAYNPSGLRETLAYLVSMDDNDPYAAGYSPDELTYKSIYNHNGSTLYEIRDIDRDKMLVGLQYKSPTTKREHIKFLVPNN